MTAISSDNVSLNESFICNNPESSNSKEQQKNCFEKISDFFSAISSITTQEKLVEAEKKHFRKLVISLNDTIEKTIQEQNSLYQSEITINHHNHHTGITNLIKQINKKLKKNKDKEANEKLSEIANIIFNSTVLQSMLPKKSLEEVHSNEDPSILVQRWCRKNVALKPYQQIEAATKWLSNVIPATCTQEDIRILKQKIEEKHNRLQKTS